MTEPVIDEGMASLTRDVGDVRAFFDAGVHDRDAPG